MKYYFVCTEQSTPENLKQVTCPSSGCSVPNSVRTLTRYSVEYYDERSWSDNAADGSNCKLVVRSSPDLRGKLNVDINSVSNGDVTLYTIPPPIDSSMPSQSQTYEASSGIRMNVDSNWTIIIEYSYTAE